MATNGSFKFVGSVIAGVLAIVVIIYNLVYSPLEAKVSAEQTARASEDKAISVAMVRGDDCNRKDFLEAIKELTAEQKRDNKEITEKLSILTTEIAIIKKEIQK